MIRTLVVDDDFRVAHIHAAYVERVDGFVCVGEAHTAARSTGRDRAGITRPADPGHLPARPGRTEPAALPRRDRHRPGHHLHHRRPRRQTVRAAMGLGAIYYLVKPFGFPQFREQLDAYRRWLEQLHAEAGETNQATIDSLFSTLRRPAPHAAGGRPELPPTMTRILHVVHTAPQPIGASAVAETLGMSRPTAQRYLTELHRKGLIELELSYGATGRPVNRYSRHR